MKEQLFYLACPYSDPDPAVREYRFHAVNRVAADMMREGYLVYSPISHSHPIAIDADLGLDWQTWQKIDLEMLKRCDALVIAELPGWDKSEGIKAEIAMAQSLKMPVLWRRYDRL